MVEALEKYPTSCILQSQCIRCIGTLAYGNALVRRRVGENGGIVNIIQAMDYHVEDETLEINATTALTNLFHNHPDNCSR